MRIKIKPSIACGEINVPPSKSYAHRLLIASGLSNNECTVGNIALSEDILATLDCLKALGKNIEILNDINSNNKIKGSMDFPRGFPRRLSHEVFPRGFPTGLSHVPPWCESILGLKVEALQGKQVSLEWTEISGGLWEWWRNPGVPHAFPVESASS